MALARIIVKRAFHAVEVPFFLGTRSIFGQPMTGILFTRRNEAGRMALSALCGACLGSFARTGDPNPPEPCLRCPTPDLPRWEAWSKKDGDPVLMVLEARAGRLEACMSAERVSAASVCDDRERHLDQATLKAVPARKFTLE